MSVGSGENLVMSMIFAKAPAWRLCRLAWLFVLGVSLSPQYEARSQPASGKDGMFVSVRHPITDEVIQKIKKKIDDAFHNKRKLDTIVFDFNPNGQPSASSNWSSCYSLAEFIRKLQKGYEQNPKVKVMAFVSDQVTHHSVLPVLACRDQIVMSDAVDSKTLAPRACIGNIGRVENKIERDSYRELADENGLGDLVERMMDKTLLLKKVKVPGAVYYLSPTELPRLPTSPTIARLQKEGKAFTVDPVLPDGLETGNGLFDANVAQRIGLCQALYNSRADLASALKLQRRSLAEDLDRTMVPWRIELRGGVDKANLDSLERRIKKVIGEPWRANFLILQLEAPGGETKDVASYADWLRTLQDNSQPIKTVAYIPPGASIGAATFLALACSEIVMGDGAYLADFAYLPEDERRQLSDMLIPLAKKQGYPPLLFEAALNPNLILYRAVNDEGEHRLLTAAEMEQDKQDKKGKEPRWQNLGQIARAKGSLLKIDTELAREWGIAQPGKVTSIEDLYNIYSLSRVRLSRDDWLDHVAEFFREPLVRFVLIMLGLIGLILELKVPGTTIPGVLAAICFVLFFWAHSYAGEFTLLAILLFVLGVILIGVEIFVVPGFGFPGIAGMLLVISGLALVTLERWPSTSEDWVRLGGTLGTFALSLAVGVTGAFLVAWFLPSIPYANRLVLNPPSDENDGSPAVPVSLLGAIGIAATSLRPAGKAQFGDDFLDVIAEGDFVNPGERVQVIEIEGNRIVVKVI